MTLIVMKENGGMMGANWSLFWFNVNGVGRHTFVRLRVKAKRERNRKEEKGRVKREEKGMVE